MSTSVSPRGRPPSSLGDSAGGPLLWVTDELPTEGARLLEDMRRPSDRVLTRFFVIPFTEGSSAGDLRRMDEWLYLAQSEEGHAELRRLRPSISVGHGNATGHGDRMDEEGDGGDEHLYQPWRAVRLRLLEALDPRSGLAAPLSAYAVEHAGALRFEDVAAVRAEYGIAADPPAEKLMPLLPLDDD